MGESMLNNQNGTGEKNDSKEKTVKYKVKNTCYWNDRLYYAGSVVTLPESAKPPVGDKGHFVKVD